MLQGMNPGALRHEPTLLTTRSTSPRFSSSIGHIKLALLPYSCQLNHKKHNIQCWQFHPIKPKNYGKMHPNKKVIIIIWSSRWPVSDPMPCLLLINKFSLWKNGPLESAIASRKRCRCRKRNPRCSLNTDHNNFLQDQRRTLNVQGLRSFENRVKIVVGQDFLFAKVFRVNSFSTEN